MLPDCIPEEPETSCPSPAEICDFMVSVSTAAASASAITPKVNQPSSDCSLSDYPWFWGDVSRDEVTERMRDKIDGTFLIRNSSSSGDYTLTLRKNGTNKLIKIYQREDKFGFSPSETLPFSSLPDLVAYYHLHSLKQYNRDLDITLKYPLKYQFGYEEDSASSTVEQLTNSLHTVHLDYLRKSKEYDLGHEEYMQTSQELNLKRRALRAFEETLASFNAQIELHKKFQEEAPAHERQRLRDNFELLLSRIDTLKCHKKKLNDEILRSSARLRQLECELNAVKPDFLYLYRRRERLTKMLQSKGLSSMTVQNMLQNFFNADDYFKGSALVGNGSRSLPDGSVVHLLPSDTSSLLITGCSKQDCVSLLSGKPDGTFLVRPSESRSGFYALSVVCSGKIHNCLIECRDDTFGFAGTEAWFPSLFAFVSYYSSHSLKDHNSDLDTRLLYPILSLHASKLQP